MPGTTKSSFERPRFTPLPPKPGTENQPETITSLPDLIEFNARHNPAHTFCIQARSSNELRISANGENATFDACPITFAQLESAVHACAGAISTSNFPSQNSNIKRPPAPLALYLESDIGLFFHLAALLTLNLPVVLISIRLSPPSVQHLLEKTGCKTVLVSTRTRPMLEGHIDAQFKLQLVKPYEAFLESKPAKPIHGRNCMAAVSNNTARPLILHSSGTTGFPKPIPLSARYPLQYAACHEFPPDEDIDWVNLSTLPLYHGFGFLAPCLSLSVGMTCCLPPSHIIPAGESTRDLLKAFDCQSLMTVPSIVDDLLALGDSATCLRSLKFLAVGGGALGLTQGTRLVEQGVKLLSHYGVTEIGALAPIFCPGPEYNWRFLRLRSDLGLELKPIQGSDRFKLVGWPHGWDGPFEVQDELERNVDGDPEHTEIRILGRTDDLIVLKTGEKVMPQHLEAALNADPAIKTAVCVGDGYFEVVVLVEHDASSLALETGQFVNHVWDLITNINAQLDSHARVSSKSSIIVKPAGKRIPRTDKGSVSRRQMYDVFADEIKSAYVAIEDERPRTSINIDSVEASIAKMVEQVFKDHVDPSRDLFEQGMDSLQALRLSRMIDSATRHTGAMKRTKPTAEFIYRHSSIERLSTAVESLILGVSEAQPNEGPNNHARMLSRLQQYTQPNTISVPKSAPQHVVLLTGATGSLGAHVLKQLTSSRHVEKVICVYRQKPSSTLNSDSYNPTSHLKAAIGSNGIILDEETWRKVEMVEDVELVNYHAGRNGQTNGHNGDAGRRPYSQTAASITHIVHLAWPMDFHRTLESFDPHLQMLKTLLELARFGDAFRPGPRRNFRVRLLFASSIAVVRDFSGASRVPETVMKSPATVAPMGYAEAKWICEHMIAHAAQEFGQHIDPVAIRIGQLSGPEGSSGVWKTGEHVPALVRASHKIGAFPDLPGTLSWIPVDRAARSLVDILFHQGDLGSAVLHLENPVRQSANQVMTLISNELGLGNQAVLPFDRWLESVKEAGLVDSLSHFFQHDFRPLALGQVVLDTSCSRRVSRTLRGSSGLPREVIAKYVSQWKQRGLFSEEKQ